MADAPSLLDQVESATGRLVFPRRPRASGPFLKGSPVSTMTEADLRHLEDSSAPISDGERIQAAAEIRRLKALVDEMARVNADALTDTAKG